MVRPDVRVRFGVVDRALFGVVRSIRWVLAFKSKPFPTGP